MKRWLWAVAAALAVQTAAHAEYVIIRVLLNPSGSAGTATGTQPGFPGGPPGGMIGGPPGGMLGMMGSPRPGGMTGGPPSGFGGGPPGGMLGMIGSPPPGTGIGGGPRPGTGITGGPPGGMIGGPPGGMIGGPPGGGFTGGPSGGGPPPGLGMTGGPRPGFPGGAGGGIPSPGGGFGAFGFSGAGPGMAGGMTGGPGGANVPNPNAKYNLGADEYVTVVIETKGGVHQLPSQNFRQQRIGGRNDITHLSINHLWGTTFLDANAYGVVLDLNRLPTPKEQLVNRQKLSKDHSPEKTLELAEWCLTVGLPDDCMSIMDKLATNEKALASPRVKTVLDAYAKVRETITGTISKAEKAKNWQERTGLGVLSVSKHYAMIHPEALQDSATRRLEYLEDNLKTFYLWFAFRGRALPAPTEKMTGILIGDTTEFRKFRDAFEVHDLVSDGFHARRENLAIFSARRLDKASVNFEQVLKNGLTNGTNSYTFEELFKNKLPDGKDKRNDKYIDYARASTLALVDNALRRESEIASATHEGTQQLFAETGLLPRNVIAPEWVRFGLGSLFEMPKGPFPGGAGKVKVAFYRGGGGPNWAYMRYYEEMRDQGLLKDSIKDFIATVTDTYFQASRKTDREPKDVDGESQETVSAKLAAKARTLSWSLTYFLAKDRYPQFEKFLQELAKLPRDAELDEDATITALAAAFGYKSSDISGADSADSRFGIIAVDWAKFMERQQSPSRQLKVDSLILQGGASGGAAPPPGGFPGGGPGAGGGIPGGGGGGGSNPGGGDN